MSTTQPVRTLEDLLKLKNYYSRDTPLEERNRLLIIMGLNTALRISDILPMRWNMVYNFTAMKFKSHIELTERKTGKQSIIALNDTLQEALSSWFNEKKPLPADYIFESSRGKRPIDRHQAYRIVRKAASLCDLSEHISCHSLRKTFGYHAWKNGVPPASLMDIFNHSSYKITMRYLCINQDDRDAVFTSVQL